MRRCWATVAVAAFLVLAGACTNAPASTDASGRPEPSPSAQPVPAPPVGDSRGMRDILLRIAREDALTDSTVAWGIRAAWMRVFPRMRFADFESPALTDAVSGGEALANERGSELTATLTFAVVDVAGMCAGGYVAGPIPSGKPTRFDALDPADACNAKQVYLIRNPEPEPEPELPPVRSSRGKKKSGGSKSNSEPTSGRGGIEWPGTGPTTAPRNLPRGQTGQSPSQ